MAGCNINGTFIDYHDGEGKAIKNSRTIYWTFHEWCGPTFLRKDREPLKIQPGEKHWVWPKFEEWLKKYNRARINAKTHEIVNV